MKPFIDCRRKKSHFTHPEDMKTILDFLWSIGNIQASDKTIENLYYEYSNSVCCTWRIVDEESLEEFAEWLGEYEI